jgi:hypothetical protein
VGRTAIALGEVSDANRLHRRGSSPHGSRCSPDSRFKRSRRYLFRTRRSKVTFFANHRDEEFLESFSFASPNRWTHWGGWYSDTSRASYLHLSFRSHWLHIPIRRKIPLGLVPHGGSNWWCLTRSAVEYVHQFLLTHPQVSNYFRSSFLPDEMFFQTILSNSPFASRITGDACLEPQSQAVHLDSECRADYREDRARANQEMKQIKPGSTLSRAKKKADRL